MKNTPGAIMIAAAFVFFFISYGFVDPHLSIFSHTFLSGYEKTAVFLVYRMPWIAALLVLCSLALFFVGYRTALREAPPKRIRRVPGWLIAVVIISLLSFPALSYDIFNYIATAKLTFFYGENPYVVMPVEIPNEPMLGYTRAANKLALYGPVWIILSSFPYIVGGWHHIGVIYSFKMFALVFYLLCTYMIYRKTKRWESALFFAANPLVLLEVLVNGHNDIVMMVLAAGGLILWSKPSVYQKVAGLVLFAASVFVKGATIALVPLFFLPTSLSGGLGWSWEKKMKAAYILMFLVFLVSPLREEMYPWYAVWWLVFAALIPITKQSFIHGFSFWLSLGLMLRYLPWIVTREYGGITPITRIVLTVIPVGLYVWSYIYPYARKWLNRYSKRV